MLDDPESLGQRLRSLGVTVGPCLSPAALESFEGSHGIRLPEDYRWFLSNVGDGCTGPPDHGLVPLGATWGLPEHPTWQEFWGKLPALAEPFPFTEPWCWAEEDRDPTLDELVTRVWLGCIYLGTDGCTMTHHLVVSGPERGHVWQCCDIGIFPHEPRQTFTEWFARWLGGKREARSGDLISDPEPR